MPHTKKTLPEFKKIFVDKSSQAEIEKLPKKTLDEIVKTHYEACKSMKKSPYVVEVKPVKDFTPETEDVIGKTQIIVASNDMAFLVDSITAEIASRGLNIVTMLHPNLEKGKTTQKSTHTVNIHLRLSNLLPEDECKRLKKDLENILSDTFLANEDWVAMKEQIRFCQKRLSHAPNKVYAEALVEDNLEFLEYLYRNNFTLLGYREYSFSKQKNGQYKSQMVKNSGLGLLRDERQPVFLNNKDISLPSELQEQRVDLPPVYVSKINKKSTVHRKVPMECINVKLFNEKGEMTGEGCFIGLFTSVTYNQSLKAIPFLRYKADQVIRRAAFSQNSHTDRVLRHILEKYPRDELFQIDIDLLHEFCARLVRLQDYKRLGLFIREDLFKRYISCLVYVPKDRWDTRLRKTFQAILENRLGGKTSDYTISIDDSPLARLSFVVSVDDFKIGSYDSKALELELTEAAKKWSEHLQDLMHREMGDEQKAFDLMQKYENAFTSGYESRYEPRESYRDILKLEEALAHKSLALDLIREEAACERSDNVCQLHLKFYNLNESIDLSSVFPIIENMGFYVASEIPNKVTLADGQVMWIQHFMLQAHDLILDDKTFADRKALFEESFLDVQSGKTEDDLLNQLSLKEGISGRDIVILRTVLRYLRQTDYTYSKTFSEQVVVKNSVISGLLVNLFKAYHDPAFKGSRKKAIEEIETDLKVNFEQVKSFDHDYIMRLFKEVVCAILRTNFFQHDESGEPKTYTSIKLDSAQISCLPEPKPYREIFVYSRRVEGVHLRGDAISRGGLRWSDRHEDFRTEVLGLMKAQMVKNAVIVPMGAKGGFVVKNPPSSGGRQAFIDEGVACYKTFIRGLLDITDNVEDSNVIPPKNIIRRDSDDPYLVVAADKGTATFSDIANGLSDEYGFWLGDAFASGGSAGYDHKEMGITARGAWESVKRHFLELGHDTQNQDFDVIGVGDMGGDVFGNGMLLSKHICLVGAFNHLHIFCDPTPNSETSWKERKRLFDGALGWGEYNESYLSKGGRIYSRQDKKITLTKQIQERFGIDQEEVSPNVLMKAMLKSNTDLLWFGGIGTYIKSKDETHGEVSDKANDAIRVDAAEVGARVIGEGANLGITQEGRIALAEHDVRVNADFIDNAGGVNSSDVEVNIKILLNKLTRGKKPKLTVKDRNKLLSSMTKDVENLVLSNNYQQAQALSLMVSNAPSMLLTHADYMRHLEESQLLDREIEFLPNDEDIDERMRDGEGLSRPELSALQCYAKNTITKDILKTDIPDHPMTEQMLIEYFPSKMIKSYKSEILEHQLRREIISTELSNTLVNRFGPAFLFSAMNHTGASLSTVIKSYLVIEQAFNLHDLWSEVEALDGKVDPQVQTRAFSDIAKIVERQIVWLSKRLGTNMDVQKQAAIYTKAVEDLRKVLPDVLPKSRAKRLSDTVDKYVGLNVPKEVAKDLAYMTPLSAVVNIVFIAEKRKIAIKDLAHVYYVIGEHFCIYWLRLQSRHLGGRGLWSGQALRELRSKLYVTQAKIAERYISDFKGKKVKISDELIDQWCLANDISCTQVLKTIHSMQDAQEIDLSMLVVAEQMLNSLYD